MAQSKKMRDKHNLIYLRSFGNFQELSTNCLLFTSSSVGYTYILFNILRINQEKPLKETRGKILEYYYTSTNIIFAFSILLHNRSSNQYFIYLNVDATKFY